MDLNGALLFDAIRGEGQPTTLFGPALSGASAEAALSCLVESANDARQRVANTFGAVASPDAEGVAHIDSLVAEIWQSGWDPKRKSFNLFATDFGVLFAAAFIGLPEFAAVFRSEQILDHVSFWSPEADTEFFPFHKIARALLSGDGESASQMYRAAIVTQRA